MNYIVSKWPIACCLPLKGGYNVHKIWITKIQNFLWKTVETFKVATNTAQTRYYEFWQQFSLLCFYSFTFVFDGKYLIWFPINVKSSNLVHTPFKILKTRFVVTWKYLLNNISFKLKLNLLFVFKYFRISYDFKYLISKTGCTTLSVMFLLQYLTNQHNLKNNFH